MLCLLAGATALIAGVTGVRRVPEFVLAGLAWPLAGLRGLPWLGRSLRSLTGRERAPRVLLHRRLVGARACWSSVCCSSPPTPSWRAGWTPSLPDISVDSIVLRVFIAVAVAGPTLAAAYLALNPPRTEPTASSRAPAVAHRFEWLVPVLLVDAVFAVFVAAQLSVLLRRPRLRRSAPPG